jgi:TRAP-type C4-dicarboxylate transport system permease small subunit
MAAPLVALKQILVVTDRVSYAAIVAVMAAMTILVSVQVICRYLFSYSIDSADELSRLFFVWAMFLAIPHGVRYGVHVGIDLVVRMLSLPAQEIVFRLVNLAGFVLMAIVFAVSWTATADKWQELMPTLPITAAVYYIPILISTGHSALHLLGQTFAGTRFWQGATL